MDYHIIYNPTARSGRSKKDFKKILKVFQQNGVKYKYTITQKENQAIEIAKSITKDKASVVVAAGGDGTIGEVVTGLMYQDKAKRPILGALHIGTSPDFPRYHGIPINTERATEFLLQTQPVKVDVGQVIHWGVNKKERVKSYFGCNVNIGLGPNIASKSNDRYRKYLGDFLGTLCATLVSLKQHSSENTVNLKLNNQETKLKNIINLTVGKDPFLASGMRVPVDIPANDGKFYCMSLQAESKAKLLTQLPRLYRGNILNYEGAELFRAEEVIVDSEDLTRIEFDGDVRGCLPATIKVLPQAIKLLK